MLISLSGKLYAQDNQGATGKPQKTKTDETFNMCEECNVHIKDVVYLEEGRLQLELFGTKDYEQVKRLDSILMDLKRDIAFYKDSIDGETGAVRIDYVVGRQPGTAKIRFKKYPADGRSFVARNGDISRLKVEQDTVHIILQREIAIVSEWYAQKHNGSHIFHYSVEATFTVDNYTDIDRIIASGPALRRIIDTLEQAKRPLVHGKYGYIQAVSSIYKPYSTTGEQRYRQFGGIFKNENEYWPLQKSPDYLTADFNIGLGLVRNTLTPTLDAGITLIKGRHNRLDDNKYYTFYTLSVSPYFFFDKNAKGDYITNTNMFVNFSLGGRENDNMMGLKSRKGAFGIGYLAISKGDYFKNFTMKMFMDIQLRNGITLSPEIIATDNFKQLFPGITFKVF